MPAFRLVKGFTMHNAMNVAVTNKGPTVSSLQTKYQRDPGASYEEYTIAFLGRSWPEADISRLGSMMSGRP